MIPLRLSTLKGLARRTYLMRRSMPVGGRTWILLVARQRTGYPQPYPPATQKDTSRHAPPHQDVARPRPRPVVRHGRLLHLRRRPDAVRHLRRADPHRGPSALAAAAAGAGPSATEPALPRPPPQGARFAH